MTDHAKSNLWESRRRLSYESQNAITAIFEPAMLSINASMSFIDGAVCAHIRFLTTCRYVYPRNMMSPYGITMPRSISFEVHVPISFYEKTCGKGSNIIEAISIIPRDCSRYMLPLPPPPSPPPVISDERRNKYAVISNFSNNPTEFSKNHLFPICAAVYSPVVQATNAISTFHPFYFRNNLRAVIIFRRTVFNEIL